MDRFLKPQTPIKDKENDYIYPLTTIDQIIGDDDRRLNIILEDDFAKKDEVSSAKTEAIDSSKVYTNEQVKRAAPRNLLDNSDFRNPVNQRGQTTYTGNRYSIDGWRAYHSDTTHTITENGLKVTATSSPNAYQILDVDALDINKQYTAAACDSDGNIVIWTGSLKNTVDIAPICVYISGDSTLFRLSAPRTWRWAALYEGEYTIDTLPEYQPKGYGVELDECRRYYQKMYIRFNGKALAVTLPVPMAAVPNISREMDSSTEPDYCYMLDNKTVDIGLYTAGDIGGYFTFEVPL